ncbi:hypothetical protein QE152_g10122 [Popillia japonica]|uniref:Uncharacterized protein n=1 Tax=Popillia japonica TaxID=7064 RepID=A0AAW1LUK4_POPJA
MLVCTVENYKKFYNPNDAEILLQLMMESNEEDKSTEFNDESDSDEEDVVEEGDEDSVMRPTTVLLLMKVTINILEIIK